MKKSEVQVGHLKLYNPLLAETEVHSISIFHVEGTLVEL